jgi:hypothetical protein
MPGLNVYCSPFLKSLSCASLNAGREKTWNIGPVNEYEAPKCNNSFHWHNNTKRNELRQQCQFLLVGVLRQRKEANFSRRQNVLLTVPSQYRY